MKRTFLPLIAALAVFAASATVSAQTIKLGTLAPKGSPWYEVLVDLKADWEAASNGSIKVTIFPGGTLGDEPDMMRKMAIGQIQASMVTATGLSMVAPEIWALQMPMMIGSYEELDYIRDRLAPEFEAALLKKNLVVLNWGEAGWVRFFSNEPMRTPEDLRKLKLFVWAGDSVIYEAWKDAGANAVPLPVPELYSALNSGMVDAYSTTSVASLSFQWFGLAPHMMDLKWAPLVGATVIRADVWRKIPKDLRAKMLAASHRAGRRFRELTRSFEQDAVGVMQEHGLTVHELTPREVALWEEAAKLSYPTIVKNFLSPELVERTLLLRQEFRRKLATNVNAGDG